MDRQIILYFSSTNSAVSFQILQNICMKNKLDNSTEMLAKLAKWGI